VDDKALWIVSPKGLLNVAAFCGKSVKAVLYDPVTESGVNPGNTAFAGDPSASGNVLTNDTDVDSGDVLTVTTTGAQVGPYGTVTIAANGAYSFALNNGNATVQALGVGETLTQSFNYTISDGNGGTSSSTLTINSVARC